ncbi:MAG: TlyA family RNA methyltransferase [Thermoleophilia bacterium]|jgi:23S rRNA (cytidine1920-2'-O)/16S rRNA (cytidine1409-2'-O)-methyltransferase|nr:TlyA family RNA methyltransferase [Thermoleophilia bacterium]
MPRQRLDAVLVERGLFPTRARAQAAVLAGRVRVDGRPAGKPGSGVAGDVALEVEAAEEFVSRGGRKLANALDALGVVVTGASAIDVGASTGGFTDCLLARGAARAIAVDVGYGQLDWRLRTDDRVHVMERTNARHLTPGDLPWTPDLAVVDVSFISARLVWPALAACLDPGGRALVLVKPQFEVGREQVGSGGVVRDPALRAQAVRDVAAAIARTGWRPAGAVDSGLPGPRGNREVVLLAEGPARPGTAADPDALAAAAVGDPA